MVKRAKLAVSFLVVMLALAAVSSTVIAGGSARRPAILNGADGVAALQRTDAGWEGTWFWFVGNSFNATNLTGVTALGLLEAYHDSHDQAYLNAAIDAAGFIEAHLGAGATGTQYHVRTTAPDIVFLHRLGEVTGDTSYATRADLEWANITSFWPTAGDLDALFRAINRRSAWDIAFFLEAAHLSGDTTWADGAAAIIADTSDTFYYDTGNGFWYALNLSATIRALVNSGYADQYNGAIVSLLNALIGITDDDLGVGGSVQDSAYAVLAYSSVGGAAQKYANDLGRWLATEQETNGGWIVDGDEYPEVNGEAVRALSSTIGTDITLDGFEPGTQMNSSWIKVVNGQAAIPFNGN